MTQNLAEQLLALPSCSEFCEERTVKAAAQLAEKYQADHEAEIAECSRVLREDGHCAGWEGQTPTLLIQVKQCVESRNAAWKSWESAVQWNHEALTKAADHAAHVERLEAVMKSAAKYRCLARGSAPYGLVFEAGHELDVALNQARTG